MWRDAVLVCGKDLRIEIRSRVLVNQVAPFAVLVLVLFAFALGPDAQDLLRAAPGVFWVAVLFSGLLAVQRAFIIEGTDGARDGLRLAGLDPAGVFLGKAAAVCVQLVLLEIVLGAGAILLFGAHIHDPWNLVAACAAGTAGLAGSGVLYGALAAGMRVRETLLPLLVLPVVAPVLVAGTKVWQQALHTEPGTPAWSGGWMPLLLVFAVVYLVLGVLLYGVLQEEAE
ncbi:MAG: heme exporter protein CcmB [Acidimicrobiales bacterium]